MGQILIINNNTTTRALWHEELHKSGHKVITVPDIDQGMTKLSNELIDLMVTNSDSFISNGTIMKATLEKIDPSIPILMINTSPRSISNKFKEIRKVELIYNPFDTGLIRKTADRMIHLTNDNSSSEIIARSNDLITRSKQLISESQRLSKEFASLRKECADLQQYNAEEAPEIEALHERIKSIAQQADQSALENIDFALVTNINQPVVKEIAISANNRLSFNIAQRHVSKGDRSLKDLTPKEFDILLLIANSPQQMVKRTSIMNSIWGNVAVNPRTVEVHLSRLRKKIMPLDMHIEYKNPFYQLYGSKLAPIASNTA